MRFNPFFSFLLTCLPYAFVAEAATTTFDYVVVGGGTAGLVVAARLAEDPNVTVAIIEAGLHVVNEPIIDTPQFFGQASGNPNFDWLFVTTPQAGLNGQSIPYPRGKLLGGSSGINFMAWDRASQPEYDAWESLGATGWNWNSLLPYFKKAEDINPQTPTQIAAYPGQNSIPDADFNAVHGRTGPLQCSYNNFYSNITGPFVQTVNSLGIATNSDPYSGDGTGIYNTEMTIDQTTGKRSYSASTYYADNADKPNLTLLQATQATKINFASGSSGSPLQAVSVNVVSIGSSGTSGTITATREVILGAGSVQTPQLLELSGIGNRTLLQSLGIQTLIDLPGVGENLMEHTLLAQDFQITDNFLTYDELRNNATFLAQQQAQYAANGTGLLASAQFALVFPTAKQVTSSADFAQLNTTATALANSPYLSPITKAQYQFHLDWLLSNDIASLEYIMLPTGGETALAPTAGDNYITLWTGMMHPWMRGSIHINSSNPLNQPAIDLGMLNNDVDVQLAVASAKFARTMTQSQPIAPFVVAPHQPMSNVSTDDQWLQYTRTFIRTIFHPMGTTIMLPQNIGGVVDPATMKVYGTANVRVVDASVIPLIFANHPQATIYAVAERAADIIKGVI